MQDISIRPAAVSRPLAAPRPARRRAVRRRIVLAALLLILLVALAAGAWAYWRPKPVDIAVVGRGEAVEAVYASGVVEYVRQARVAPVVTAPIRQVMVQEGAAVRAGQALAQLEDGPQAGVTLQLRAQADLARAGFRRTDRLYQAGFAAPAAREDAQSQLRAAEAAARGAQAHLTDYRVRAPFTGRVLRRDAEPGDMATVGAALFVVADTSALRVTADVDERDVARLAVGQHAVLRSDAFPGRTFAARISELTPQGDSSGRVFRARLALPPDSPLKPGMTVEANLVTARREQALLVPARAVRDGAAWRIDGGRACRTPVVLGARGDDKVEVRSGLDAGDRVVVDPTGLAAIARIRPRSVR